jgi:hypothetical protein
VMMPSLTFNGGALPYLASALGGVRLLWGQNTFWWNTKFTTS